MMDYNDATEDKVLTCSEDVSDIKIEYGRGDNKGGKLLGRKAPDVAYRHRLFHTACVWFTIFGLGWRNALIGPTLPDLRLIINEDLSTTSWIFTAKSLGGLFGSVCGGFAYDRFNKLAVFISTVLAMGVVAAITPWCYHLAAMLVVHACHGIFGSAVETAAIADMAVVWKQDAGPYMQAVQFAFSVGAMVSPLIAEPFLAERIIVGNRYTSVLPNSSAEAMLDLEMIAPTANVGDITTHTGLGVKTATIEYGKTRVYVPYSITSLVCFMSACLYLLVSFVYGNVYRNSLNESPGRKTNIGTCPKRHFLSKKMKVMFTVLLALAILFYVVSEHCFIGFLMTFVISEIEWSKAKGSTASSAFWIAFATGRLSGIILVKFVNISIMILIFSSILTLGAVLFFLAVMFGKTFLVWVSVGVIGYGMSVIFSLVFSWLSQNIRTLTGKMTSIFFVFMCIGTMVIPILVGYLMDKISQMWFIYSLLILSTAMFVCFILALVSFCLVKKGKIES
ncbi:sodium-dependent glucose transporter 1A-like [Mercenaria mercenaria]|uniref:sodium-dependent glucose transporter 1A-like n=1 Tax=Mercenaria mercenaria TaxID=6596 RepID=UPI00234E6BA4|nr:sodium-dependent glucose transporter 1A-like [Mercenaria mercenaria]